MLFVIVGTLHSVVFMCSQTVTDSIVFHLCFVLCIFYYCQINSLEWNSMPDHLWDPAVDSEQFRWDLKMYFLQDI